jgi:hypothetical protein
MLSIRCGSEVDVQSVPSGLQPPALLAATLYYTQPFFHGWWTGCCPHLIIQPFDFGFDFITNEVTIASPSPHHRRHSEELHHYSYLLHVSEIVIGEGSLFALEYCGALS